MIIDLQVGDIVKYTKGASTLITGLADGKYYKVKAVTGATTFTLENLDGLTQLLMVPEVVAVLPVILQK